eukprot:25573_1
MKFGSILSITISFFYTLGHSQITYNGPASNEYFVSDGPKSITGLPELACGEYYLGQTNKTNPVVYYRFNLKKEMFQMWKSQMKISTCCGPREMFNLKTNKYVECHPNDTKAECEMDTYLTHCNKYHSLDTVIYVLYYKKRQLNLIETVDDVMLSKKYQQCIGNEDKSVINLAGYSEGNYVIGIGGYAKRKGAYALRLHCVSYSWDIKYVVDELDPTEFNTNFINYNETISDSFIINNQMNHMKYYQFQIKDNTYLPIIITACVSMPRSQTKDSRKSIMVPAHAFIFAKNQMGGSAFKILRPWKAWTSIESSTTAWRINPYGVEYNGCPDGVVSAYEDGKLMNWFGQVFVLNNSFEFDQGTYYVALQAGPGINLLTYCNVNKAFCEQYGYGNGEIKLKIISAPAPTVSPTYSPSINPTETPTHFPSMDPTPSPTYKYSFPIKEKSEMIQGINIFKQLSRGATIPDQMNTKENEVLYYAFTKDNNIYQPSYITTCSNSYENNNTLYGTYIYIIRAKDGEIVLNSDSTILSDSNDRECEIEISSLKNGEYYAVVQGIDHKFGNFSISMKYTEPPPKIPKELVMGLVFGIM